MQALDAGLAFAITMLILAMVVTTIVETIHRILGLREKGLALLLGNFYDRILASRTGAAARGPDDRRWFIEMMTVNRGPVGRVPTAPVHRALHVDDRSEDWKFLSWIWSGRRLGDLGVTAFMERLGGSEYGAALASQASAAGEKAVEWMLKDVAQKFDAFGREASEYFESRARLLSVLVGFALAFAVNVNAIVLFETYMKRPDISNEVIKRGKGATDAYEKLQKNVDALNTSAANAQGKAAGAAPGTPPAEAPALQRSVDEARASVEKARDEAAAAVKNLQSVGVPIGWNPQAAAEFDRSRLMSILGLVLGGLLIGLGAPFWYKAVQSLTSVRTLVGGKAADTAKPGGATSAAAAPTQLPSTPIDAFHAALGATLAAGEMRPPEEAVG